MRKVNFPFAHKLALSMILLIIFGMVAFGALMIRDQNQLFETQMHSYAKILIYELSASAKESYLTSDTLDLDAIVKNLSQYSEVPGIAFYSEEKQILTSAGLIPQVVTFPDSTKTIITQHWTPPGQAETYLSYIGGIAYKDITMGYVLVTFDQSLYTHARIRTLYTIILITIILVLLTILVAFFLGKRLSKPIEDLVDASNAISTGNYKIRFDDRRNDEFGILMESLNVMAEGLLHKESVEQAFSRYVSPKVAQEVLSNLQDVNLGGQQIDASVLFVDIIGYSKLSQHLEPDEITQMLNEYFSYIDQAAQIYGGHVDKYIGDCAMLVFGVPEKDEHHSFQAVSCALLIQKMISTINIQRERNNQLAVNFHIAANSGLMLAGNMGSHQRMEYTVIGDSVNLASRIASYAHNNEVIIPDTMMSRPGIKDNFYVEEKTRLNLRSHDQPITLYRVTGCINNNNVDLTTNMEKLLNYDFNQK
jgi:adenylate cyclase